MSDDINIRGRLADAERAIADLRRFLDGEPIPESERIFPDLIPGTRIDPTMRLRAAYWAIRNIADAMGVDRGALDPRLSDPA